jgi:DNA-binding transcriptional regulator YdaS (Cro superfamily)
MSNPELINQLLDAASEAAGSDYKLAQMLETSRSTLSQIRAGKRPCPIGDVALMAVIAGLKPEEWMARAVIAQYEGTSKGDKLFRALGKASLAIGGVIASSGASAHQIFSHKGAETIAGAVSYFIRCIERLSLPRFNYRSFNLT